MTSSQEREAALFALALEKPAAERAAFLQVVCRRDFAKGRAALKLALGDKPGHDRGEGFRWRASYDAESWRTEAEAVFKTKGIPLPEPDAK
jgi:hypothetical protein